MKYHKDRTIFAGTTICSALFMLMVFFVPESSATLSGKKIGIDPGHGAGVNGGVVIAEGTWVLDAGFRARTHLQNDGAQVVMTRTTGTDVSLSSRYNMLNSNNVHVAVSIHSNASGSSSTNGMSAFYCSQNPSPTSSQNLATDLRLRSLSMVHNNNRGTKECLDAGRGFHFAMVKNTNMPTTLTENYYHTNSWENNNIHNTTSGREDVARGIYAGVCDYFGQTPVFGAADAADEMFFYRDDGLFRYYNVSPDGYIGQPILAGDNYTTGWSSITAVDLDGDGQDEMFFYRKDDGLFRYYNVSPAGYIGQPILAGDNYTTGWAAITAVQLDHLPD